MFLHWELHLTSLVQLAKSVVPINQLFKLHIKFLYLAVVRLEIGKQTIYDKARIM